MKKIIIFFITLVVLTIAIVLTYSLVKEINKNTYKQEQVGAETWSYKGTLIKNADLAQGDLYGIDTTLIYNSHNKTFYEKSQAMGTSSLIKYYIISNDSIKLVVDAKVNVKYDFYNLNFNRAGEVGAPEDVCSSAAIITTQGEEKIIELKYNKNYKEGELKNIQISFGVVD